MDVERGATIHGIAASALKAMLTKRDGRFTTPQAMADLGLVEPAATGFMIGLARDGFVEFVGRANGMDAWEAGEAGRRLMASRIGKRFPAREGRRIVEAVVAAAREVNVDAGSPVRVTWIALFGSMLDAEDDDLVGDVDLMVRVRRRRLPKEELRRLEEARLATAPPSGKDRLAPYWSTISLLRRLGRVSARASLMDASTLDLGIRHRDIYAYEVVTEAEVPVSGRIRTSKARADEAQGSPKAKPVLEVADARPWPNPPDPGSTPDPAAPDRLAHGGNLVAQHMWRRGLGIEEISTHLLVPERTVQAYLAAQATRPFGLLVVEASLAATLTANVPSEVAVVREASAEIGRGRNSGVRVTLSKGMATCAGAMSGGLVLLDGDMSFAPLVERACDAAERWRRVAAGALRGVVATCQVGPGLRTRGEVEHGVPDLTPLRTACEAWLRGAGPVVASFGTHGRSMNVEVGGPAGAKVGSPWKDRDPNADSSVMAEAERLQDVVRPTGVTWTFWFSSGGETPSKAPAPSS